MVPTWNNVVPAWNYKVPSWNYIVPTWNHMVPIKPVNLHFLILKYLRIGFSKNRFHIHHHKNMLIVSSTLKSWKIPTFFSRWNHIQSVPKKMSFLGKIATTTFKLIQNAKAGGVLENSGYLLPDGHWDFQNWRRNDWENEAWSCQPPSKNGQNSLLSIYIDWSSQPFFRAFWSLNSTHQAKGTKLPLLYLLPMCGFIESHENAEDHQRSA